MRCFLYEYFEEGLSFDEDFKLGSCTVKQFSKAPHHVKDSIIFMIYMCIVIKFRDGDYSTQMVLPLS